VNMEGRKDEDEMGPEGDKRWDMSVQDTQSWNGSVRDGGCIPRVSRSQSRDGGRPAASFGML